MSLMAAMDRVTNAVDHFETLCERLEARFEAIERKLDDLDTSVYELTDQIKAIGGEVDALVGTLPDIEELADQVRRTERLAMLTDARTAMQRATTPVEYAF